MITFAIRRVSERVARCRLTRGRTKRVYCTYFDHNYCRAGLRSIIRFSVTRRGSRLWVLCLSEACHQTLVALDLPHIVAVRLAF